uniref:Defensin n=1 Tax=Sinohyriopsis schlegelii TaxID=2706150 RepID=G1E712_SINSH|nr:defensin [Sinohyriopsis schlegelii]
MKTAFVLALVLLIAVIDLPQAEAGFGCNGPKDHDPYQCNAHCRRNGFTGGYCNAWLLWYRCDCYN